MKIIKNKKLMFMIVLSALYIGFASPTAFTYATIQENVEEKTIDGADASEEGTTTIEEEPVAEAAILEQNRATYMTQILIISLGIIMAGVGTYVFILKEHNK